MYHLDTCGGRSTLETAVTAEQSSPRYWQELQAHTGPRFASGFENFLHAGLLD
jgi:hypothetical protein